MAYNFIAWPENDFQNDGLFRRSFVAPTEGTELRGAEADAALEATRNSHGDDDSGSRAAGPAATGGSTSGPSTTTSIPATGPRTDMTRGGDGSRVPQLLPNESGRPITGETRSGTSLTEGPSTGPTSLPDLFTPEATGPGTQGSQDARAGNTPLAPSIVAAANANRAAMQVPHQYRLVRKLHATEEIWLVQRVSDDMEFVGWRWDIPQLNPDFAQLLGRGAGDAVAAVLNHPNLVSHIDLHQVPFWHGRDFEYRDYAISDYMDAGTLRNFIDKTPVLPKIELRTGAVLQWLPEGLVWHVAMSLLNALTWLHEGVRQEDTIEWGDCETATRGAARQTPRDRKEDWWPILHRDLRTDQVFFQHPRGIETYGSCKLGGFGSMFVSGHVHDLAVGTVATSCSEDPEVAVRDVLLKAQTELQSRMDGEANPVERKQMCEDYTSVEYRDRPYLKGTETFKVGAILWQMMTRQLLPDPESCQFCRKNHWAEIRSETDRVPDDPSGTSQALPGHSEAKHQCAGWRTGVFRRDEWLAWLSRGADPDQPDAGYSPELIGLMSQLLDPQSFRRTVSTYDLLHAAKTGYLEWRKTTEEGKRHVDHWDDMVHREKNRRKQVARDRDLAVKQSGPRAQEYVQLAMGGAAVV